VKSIRVINKVVKHFANLGISHAKALPLITQRPSAINYE